MIDWNTQGPRLLAALKGVTEHPCIDLDDLVSRVYQREGQGWNGRLVKAWTGAVAEAREATKAAD